MSTFLNSVDELGDNVVVDMILTGTIEEFRDDTVTVLGRSCLSYLFGALKKVDCPNAIKISNSAFYYSYDLEYVRTSAKEIESSAFDNVRNLKAVVLCGEHVCSLQHTNTFTNCYHFHGIVNASYNPNGLKDGYIYVPRALVDSYKTATNWSTLATQFRALEDYTVDGTITGELDTSKI